MKNFNELFASLKSVSVIAHYRHLSTPSHAEHMALGELYNNIDDLADRLAEVYLDKSTDMYVPRTLTITIPSRNQLSEYLITVRDEFSKTAQATYPDPEDPETQLMLREDLKNICAEISELLSKISYLLSLS